MSVWIVIYSQWHIISLKEEIILKKIINAVDQVENQMIEGMVKAFPQYVKKLDCGYQEGQPGGAEHVLDIVEDTGFCQLAD